MKLKLRHIKDKGLHLKERVVIKVLVETDLGEFVLARCMSNNGAVLAGPFEAVWFPDMKVRSGDFVVVYSKSGRNTRLENENGTSTHFFYWGRLGSLWENDSHVPVLMNVGAWERLPAEE